MGRKKADLMQRDGYGRLVAALRSTEMLCAVEFRRALAYSIRVEFEGAGPWDDIFEDITLPSGENRSVRWQVKRQTGSLNPEEIERLLVALGDAPLSHRAALGLPAPVSVKGVGSTATLLNLIQRAQHSGCAADALATTAEEKRWWSFLARAAASPDARIELLRRLEVHSFGDEANIQKLGCDRLGALFDEPRESIFNELRAYFSSIHDGVSVDVPGLNRTILAPYHAQRLPIPASLSSKRREFLAAVRKFSANRVPLAGALPEVALSEIWVPALQVGAATDDNFSRSLGDCLKLERGGDHPISLVGEVGRGKTELLVRTAADLANTFEADDLAPVPLLVDARALVSVGLERAARDRWSQASDAVALLFKAQAVRFVVLVDGLDEVGAHGLDAVSKVRDELGPRLYSLVVATRPVFRSALPGAHEIRLSAWDATALEQFLSRWSNHDSGSVSALRASPSWASLSQLCDGPLTTTMCLLAVRDDPNVLTSRARVYSQVVGSLFQRWASARAQRTGITTRWVDVAPALRRLALETVRRDRTSIRRSELKDLLRSAIRDDDEAAEDAITLHLGVLALRGDGEFDFAFRSLAEFLAGQQLLELGDTEVIRAGSEAWGGESVRHAVGAAAIDASSRAQYLLSELLRGEDGDDIATRNDHLRAVVLSVRLAADLGDLAAPAAQTIASACRRRLLDETSVWVGDEVADAVREVARAGGPCWELIFHACLASLRDQRSAVSPWYAAQDWSGPEPWVSVLLVRDPGARGIAIARLARWINSPWVRHVVLRFIADEGNDLLDGVPAIAAGRALRTAERDAHWEGVRTVLVEFLRARGQLRACAAALALRLDEVDDAHVFVRALRDGSQGFRLPPEVVEELAKDERGLLALVKVWPSWGTDVHRLMPAHSWPPEADPTPEPPPSAAVRARLSHATAPGLPHVSALDRASILFGPQNVDAACLVAEDAPQLAVELLTQPPATTFPIISPQAADSLGRAALRYTSVRDALVARWTSFESYPWPEGMRRKYPGRALEPLVSNGDSDATRIFAEWLPLSPYCYGGTAESLRPDVLRPEAIASAAQTILASALEHATEGRLDAQGQRTRLYEVAAGSLFHVFASSWSELPSVWAVLEAWIADGSQEAFLGALHALEGLPLAERVRRLVVARTLSELASVGSDGSDRALLTEFSSVPFILRFVHRAGLAADVRPALERLADSGRPIAWHAAAILGTLMDLEDANAVRASTAAAGTNWHDVELRMVDDDILRRFVGMAPEAWADALEARIGHWGIVPFATIAPFLRALPVDLKRRVAREWRSAQSNLEFPWVGEGNYDMKTSRPADRIRQIAFDLGIEREIAEEGHDRGQ